MVCQFTPQLSMVFHCTYPKTDGQSEMNWAAVCWVLTIPSHLTSLILLRPWHLESFCWLHNMMYILYFYFTAMHDNCHCPQLYSILDNATTLTTNGRQNLRPQSQLLQLLCQELQMVSTVTGHNHHNDKKLTMHYLHHYHHSITSLLSLQLLLLC